MMYSLFMLIFSIIFLMMFMILLFYNMFISIEIPLINMMTFNIQTSFILDWPSMLFLSTVLFISSMIMMYSLYYIPNKEHKMFSLLMMMFVLSMMTLIISDNMIFILLGWDGLGLSSYMLVVYYQNYSSAASGSITFLSNRIGDIMILLSIAMIMATSNWNMIMNEEFNFLPLMLIMIAMCTKSAQFPFSAWLPAAMAAPTPISALVHSSTLVTAGVYLSIRIMNFSHPNMMFLLMILSSSTAIYASMSANWEQDLKKIIALSTLSQIAMMMFASSLGCITLTLFHLIIHALFKSTMFLCAGTNIHNSSYQDMRMMSINSTNTNFIPFMIGLTNMALMGIPFLSGFFSKDTIIENMMISNYNMLATMLMIMSIGMTATYSLRMLYLSNKTFLKSKPDQFLHNNMYSSIPITFMTPFSIFSGTIMTWSIYPEQSMSMPTSFKMLIIITLMMGLIMGLMLSFKTKKYLKTGESSISIWFTHFLSIWWKTPLSKPMLLALKNDQSWQEWYGPSGMFSLNITNTKKIKLIINSSLFILLMMTMIPMIMLFM